MYDRHLLELLRLREKLLEFWQESGGGKAEIIADLIDVEDEIYFWQKEKEATLDETNCYLR